MCFLCFLSYFSILFVSQLRIKSRPIRQNDVHSSLRGFRFFFPIDWYFTESVKFLQSLQYISMQTLCTQKCTLLHCQTVVHVQGVHYQIFIKLFWKHKYLKALFYSNSNIEQLVLFQTYQSSTGL